MVGRSGNSAAQRGHNLTGHNPPDFATHGHVMGMISPLKQQKRHRLHSGIGRSRQGPLTNSSKDG